MRRLAVLSTCALTFGLYTTVLVAQGAAGVTEARTAATLRLEVVSSTATFRRVDAPTGPGIRVEPGQIVVEGSRPAQLLVQVWKLRQQVGAVAGDRDLVLAAPVRLERDSTGRASGAVPPSMAKALEAAAARPNAYVIVVVY